MGVTVTLFTLFVFGIFSKNFKMTDVTYLFTMMIFLGVSLQSLLFLRYYPQYNFFVTGGEYKPNVIQSGLLIVYVLIGVTTTDVGAYFIGVLFGKHKMNSRISPKKTWKDFGGLLLRLLLVSLSDI